MIQNKLQQLPYGAIKPDGYLKTQLNFQAKNITGNMELYPEFSQNSGWLGGDGENWERGTYYTRGLVGVAYTLNDKSLIKKAKKWIDWSLNSQKENGDFGANEDLWAKMPMLCAIRDYYLAEKYLGNDDERVMPFFENYFKFEKMWFSQNELSSWAAARGADNVEVLLWFYEQELECGKSENDCQWLVKLANKIMSQTQDWEKEMRLGGKLRHHVVNTTQGFKHPFVKYKLNGDKACCDSFFNGLESIYNDHGRIDNLPNADEAPRDNLPTRGTETCAVVEGLYSLSVGGYVSGISRLYDIMESYAYNNLPNCFDYDVAGYCYFQLENEVMSCHGTHGFVNDHGDSSSYGISGFECCFSNCHMGYPKFIQNMWLKDNDILVKTCYGENTLTTVIDGKNIIIKEKTGYPYNDKVVFEFLGDSQNVKILFRVPQWSKFCKINGENIQAKNGYVYFEKQLISGDQICVEFKSDVEVVSFHNNSKFIRKGVALFCLPIKELWRETTDNSFRGIKYQPEANTKNYEIIPMENWNYSFDDFDFSIVENINYDKTVKISQQNYPVGLKVKMNRVINWKMKRNIADTLISNADFDKEITEKTLIPTAFSRLKISVFPNRGSEVNKANFSNTLIDSQWKRATDGVSFEKIGDYVFVSFPIHKSATYIIKYVDENFVQQQTEKFENNFYKFSGDPYGAKIEKDKYAIYVGKNDKPQVELYENYSFTEKK